MLVASFFILMTLDQALQKIHRAYEQNVDYPTSTDDDYQLRMGLIGDAIDLWGTTENINWRELFVTLVSAATGDKVTTAGDAVLDMPTDFVRLATSVTINSVVYTFVKPERVKYTIDNVALSTFCYITGTPTAYKLNVYPAPTVSSLTVEYMYYKTPTRPTTGTDILPMSMPDYAIYMTLARLYEGDTRNDMVTFNEAKAKGVLDQMIIANELPPANEPLSMGDTAYELTGAAFGQ